MTGFGISGGAVSIVNAVSSGFGAAFGISLSTKAEVCEADEVSLSINGHAASPFFAEELLSEFNRSCGTHLAGAGISVVSDIPQSVGLKSSSAAANAILLALADEADVILSPESVLQIGAKASMASGISITGAFDDAAACLLGGAVFTDNYRMKILKQMPMPENLTAVIVIPSEGGSASAAFPKERLDGKESRRIFEEAKAGGLSGLYSAMEQNGALVSRALGISDDLFHAAKTAGAVSAGVSGTGPALGILAETDTLDEFLSELRPAVTGCRCITAEIRNRRL